MPSAFPGSPKILKGALIVFEGQFLGPIPNVIVFQFNPNQMSRRLAHRAAPPDPGNAGAGREDVQRVMGPPVETISMTVELNAVDQLDEPELHPHVAELGLNPALAALELLLYPSTAQVLQNLVVAQAGTVQICPAKTPLVLFVWGPSRVLPVRLNSFSITEEAYDTRLNPIKANVSLELRVLTYLELKQNTIGYNAYFANQIQKEVQARLNLISSVEEVIGMSPF